MNLKSPYPSVEGKNGFTFGGDQRASKDAVMRRCGCGVVAAADLLIYLHLHHAVCFLPPLRSVPQDRSLTQKEYDCLLKHLQYKYFPLVYPFGTSGIALAYGLNRFFYRCGVPYRARWGVPADRFWAVMERMLQEDLPVILAIGMNFPKVWMKEKLPFYRENGAKPVISGRVRAHFVVVTAMDEEWMQVSTWGTIRYIRRSEYEHYMRRQSGSVLSNLLLLEKI